MPVRDVGEETTTVGGTASILLTPALALGDLEVSDRDLDVQFPLSGSSWPRDSVVRERKARASAWIARLASGVARGLLADSAYQAQTRVAAEDDVGARATIARAIAASSSDVRRSFIAWSAIEAFTDTLVADSVLRRRLPMSAAYLARLEAMPSGGYVTRRDSLAVLDRTLEGEAMLLVAALRVGSDSQVMSQMERLLRVVPRLAAGERIGYFTHSSPVQGDFPLEGVATVLLSGARGRAALAAFKARVLSVSRLTPWEERAWPPGNLESARASITEAVNDRFVQAEALGNSVPTIPAHAWLNTADSVYATVPRSHAMNDGIVRVLVPRLGTCREECAKLAVFDRVQRRCGSRCSVVVPAETFGYALTDIVDPAAEVAWLRSLWIERQQFTMTFAVWAGAKRAASFNGRRPEPSPLRRYPWPRTQSAVLVDGRGIVRGYFAVETQDDAAALEQAISYLLDEANGVERGSLPRTLVPASLVGGAS